MLMKYLDQIWDSFSEPQTQIEKYNSTVIEYTYEHFSRVAVLVGGLIRMDTLKIPKEFAWVVNVLSNIENFFSSKNI